MTITKTTQNAKLTLTRETLKHLRVHTSVRTGSQMTETSAGVVRSTQLACRGTSRCDTFANMA